MASFGFAGGLCDADAGLVRFGAREWIAVDATFSKSEARDCELKELVV